LNFLLFTFVFLAGRKVKDATKAVTDKTHEAAQGASRKGRQAKQETEKGLKGFRKSVENFFK
jgi:hypothetical protein